jgi:precorrin-4/cobalt-precorrin-4 C11-methyltransferase
MIYFIGAGCGDIELLTIKAVNILKQADFILYTGSLIPKKILSWCKKEAIIIDSQKLKYNEIFELLLKYQNQISVRLHTGDPSIYSTIAKQISFLKQQNIPYQVIPGISAAFGAAAQLGIEYTIPGISQTLILSRIDGNTPNPLELKQLLLLKQASYVFYLSIKLIDKLINEALNIGYDIHTPCWVVEKATWQDEKIYKGNLSNIKDKVSHIQGIALILFGDFLNQQESINTHLYNTK